MFWTIIQDGNARTTPGKAVGFCFIPFFSLYWIFVAYLGLAKDMNAYCDARSISGPKISEALALTTCIIRVVAPFIVLPIVFIGMAVPFFGLLALLVSIPQTVVEIIMMKQFSDCAAAIALKKQQ